MYSISASAGRSALKLTSVEQTATKLMYNLNMCIELSKSNSNVASFICPRCGLTVTTINAHYKQFIMNMQQVAPQEYTALTLATYLRISNEKGFTRKDAAFILNLALSTLNNRYKNYIERNQGI